MIKIFYRKKEEIIKIILEKKRERNYKIFFRKKY